MTAIDPKRTLATALTGQIDMHDSNTEKPDSKLPMLALLIISAVALGAKSTETIQANGTFEPDGSPQQSPVRIDAGEGCVVDVKQAYDVKGTLAGSFNVDFRILLDGPCGYPLGTFAEKWIARGTFDGSVNGNAASAIFTYTATAKAGGEVSGQIVLGYGLKGSLRVHGNFSDGQLVYEGLLTAFEQEQR